MEAHGEGCVGEVCWWRNLQNFAKILVCRARAILLQSSRRRRVSTVDIRCLHLLRNWIQYISKLSILLHTRIMIIHSFISCFRLSEGPEKLSHWYESNINV